MRREVEYRLNLWAAHAKMRKKNEILPALQDKFERELLKGNVLSLEAGADDWLESLVGELDA